MSWLYTGGPGVIKQALPVLKLLMAAHKALTVTAAACLPLPLYVSFTTIHKESTFWQSVGFCFSDRSRAPMRVWSVCNLDSKRHSRWNKVAPACTVITSHQE